MKWYKRYPCLTDTGFSEDYLQEMMAMLQEEDMRFYIHSAKDTLSLEDYSGDLSTGLDLLISGQSRGNLYAPSVILRGIHYGNVHAQLVRIEGELHGNVECTCLSLDGKLTGLCVAQSVHLKKTSVLDGSLWCAFYDGERTQLSGMFLLDQKISIPTLR